MESSAEKFERWAKDWEDKLPNLAKALRNKDLQEQIAILEGEGNITLLIEVAKSVVHFSKGADQADAWVEIDWETVEKAKKALSSPGEKHKTK